MSNTDQLMAALTEIAKVANTAVGAQGVPESVDHNHGSGPCAECGIDAPGCAVKSLPTRLLVGAALTARSINPVNAPSFGSMQAMPDGVDRPLFLAVTTTKYWGPQLRKFSVSFMEPTQPDLAARIVKHLNAWSSCCGISFALTSGIGEVRISRGPGGYWSYLGTDILHIPKDRPTMNLQGFTMKTPESEYLRVVRHEAGHTLGFPHEHMRKALIARIDPAKAYEWFLTTYGWDKLTVDQQVLTPLSESNLMATPPDQTSIMCYQLPAAITKDGLPITGGTNINKTDCAFAGKVYPKAGRALVTDENAPESRNAPPASSNDWPPEQDVEVVV